MSDGIHGEWWSCESEGERDAALAEVGPVAVAAGVAAIKIGTLRVGLYGTWEAHLRLRGALAVHPMFRREVPS
jgi:hypothetical protein